MDTARTGAVPGECWLAARATGAIPPSLVALQLSPERIPIPMADQQLLQAARNGDVDAVRAAFAAGADVEARDEHQRTPLLLAALGDHVDVARELVKAGADPNAQDDRRDSAFLVTGVTGSVAMLEALLPANPDFTVTNRFGGISIIPASERGHVDYVRAAARAGLNVDHVNRLGWTALLEAVILGDGSRPYQEIVQILLDAGADANIPDHDGVTALRHAEAHGYTKIAEILRSAT
ncbi:ankyrin repeat domain-containing protein [Saccharopolyspora shandongensis]|uniref:ankyrin repeat domain-containing protein n=1 Tax=Saccharopolyspora shandongensis TaxID=418495 RepID=UPI00340B0C17